MDGAGWKGVMLHSCSCCSSGAHAACSAKTKAQHGLAPSFCTALPHLQCGLEAVARLDLHLAGCTAGT